MAGLGGLLYGGVLAYRAAHAWTRTEFAGTEIAEPVFDFSKVALTHPRSVGDPLPGSFHFHDIYLFYRSDWGRPVLARRPIMERAQQVPGVVATEEEIIFVDNVLPSFITTWAMTEGERTLRHYLFFTDGLNGNAIFRADTTGTQRNVTRVTAHAALHLTIIGDYMYYANFEQNNILCRVDLRTLEVRPLINIPVYRTATDGERLFFLSGEEGGPFGVYSLHPDDPDLAITRLAANAGFTLLFDEASGHLFFDDAAGAVRAVTVEGERVNTWDNIRVQSFTVDGDFIIFTEEGSLVPRMLHMRWNERTTLDAAHWLAYIWSHRGVLYGIDHINPTLTHMLQLP
jgi:hypothetical protein